MTADTPLKRHKSLTLLSLLRRPSFNRPAPANAPTDASPFADQTDVAPTRQAYQTSRTQSKNNMREALQDVVVIPCFPDAAGTLADSDRCAFPQTIRAVDPPAPTRSDTNGSLVDTYGATNDILSAYDEPAPPPPPKQREPRSSSNPRGKSPQAGRPSDKKAVGAKKPDVPFDVIDRLDISGLYGGGGGSLLA